MSSCSPPSTVRWWWAASLEGRRSQAKLLQANQRLNIAYLFKESSGQSWIYQSKAWTRYFFENWKQALKWQRLKPYQKFARMVDRRWDGIAAYCQLQNKVPLGFGVLWRV